MTARLPGDPAWPGLTPDDLCLVPDTGVDGEVADATKHKRATAIARYAAEAGCCFNEVRCRKRYCRIYTRQEAWDEYGMERMFDECAEDFAEFPDEPPADWEVGEHPCWGFVERGVPGALPIWVCETKATPRWTRGGG